MGGRGGGGRGARAEAEARGTSPGKGRATKQPSPAVALGTGAKLVLKKIRMLNKDQGLGLQTCQGGLQLQSFRSDSVVDMRCQVVLKVPRLRLSFTVRLASFFRDFLGSLSQSPTQRPLHD